jgi:hypothetical protein
VKLLGEMTDIDAASQWRVPAARDDHRYSM